MQHCEERDVQMQNSIYVFISNDEG